MTEPKIYPMEEKYQEYLIDESRFSGKAESISFPETEEEVIEIVKTLSKEQTGITIQGGKTGITGAAVPNGGHILNLSQMTKCRDAQMLQDGTGRITVEPGIRLMDLNKEIDRKFRKPAMFWPVQPTETSASVGGILALDAQGINGYYYGDSRQYVEQIRMVLADGNVRTVKRGQKIQDENGEMLEELDAILGCEGLYGVITEAVLVLLPKPESVWGISFFFESLKDAGSFVKELEQAEPVEGAVVTAAEYIDRTSLNLIESRKNTMTKIKEVPDVDSRFQGMVYLELAGIDENIEELAEILMESAQQCNSDPDEAWAVSGETEVERMHAFRHAAAETANLYIEDARREDGRITKLGTDMSARGMTFEEAVLKYQKDMETAKVHGCIFGHIGENHLHVNILPRNYGEYQLGEKLIAAWVSQAHSRKEKIVMEHGIGKLKNRFTDEILSAEEKSRILNRKKRYDPCGIWNRGNIFPEEKRL